LKKFLAMMILGLFAAAATPVLAAENAQQERMKACNKDAGEKKGDERKKFMSTCLSDKKKADDNKMSACNTKSKGMKGDDRKKFMSDCMKKAA
jgi:psiF repeat